MKFGDLWSMSEQEVIEFLQDKGLLHRQRLCARGHVMKLATRSGRTPTWRSRAQGCSEEVSVRTGTWFEGPRGRLPLRTIIPFIYDWCREFTPVWNCVNELGMSKNTAVAWNHWMRVVAAEVASRQPLMISGHGLIVELDETMLSKRKYNVGRMYPQQWVFGGICRQTKEFFAVPVQDRCSATLIALIKKHVRPGTVIMTDKWKGY
uniref:ISXO2-like transposase domain-containing protein n=1 Tax=Trichuris muris TaxID=70415 RepID=A0A5S6QH49_TRIMR